MKLEEVENPGVISRWQEVLDHRITVVEALPDSDGGVILGLDKEDAEQWGLYPVLAISPEGTIAEQNVDIPFQYKAFQGLLKAAAVRTAST